MTDWSDINLIREAVKAYEAYRKAKQLDDSPTWREKIRADLEAQGYPVKPRHNRPVDEPNTTP